MIIMFGDNTEQRDREHWFRLEVMQKENRFNAGMQEVMGSFMNT